MKLSYDEIAGLCRRQALLLHAGIGAADGLFLLAEDETGNMQTLLQDMGKTMDGGKTLREAMEDTGAFPACVTGMVHVGERSGRLEEMLNALAEFYDQRSRSSRRIRQALTYPALILLLMLVVIGVLLTKVLPVFDDVYASLGSRLTGVAAGLLQLGEILESALPVLLLLLALVAAAGVLYTYCPPVHEKASRLITAHFGDRGINRKFNNANFARALAMGLGSALPLEEAVEGAGSLLADIPAAAERCRRCADALRGGTPLQTAMCDAGFLTPAHGRMLCVGLRQGGSDRVMAEIADRLMEDAEDALERSVSAAEPAMVLIASILVGLILLAVMLPLMNVLSAIG